MWSGVIVMIRTITTWTVTSATIATGTFGRRRIEPSEAALERSASGDRRRDDVVGERVRVRPERDEREERGRPTKTTGTR